MASGCSDDEEPIIPEETCASAADCTAEAPECVSSCYGSNPAADCPPIVQDMDDDTNAPGQCVLVDGCNHTSEPVVVDVEFKDGNATYDGSICAGALEIDHYKLTLSEPKYIRYTFTMLDFGEPVGTDYAISLNYSVADNAYGTWYIEPQFIEYQGFVRPDPEAILEVETSMLNQINTAKLRSYQISFKEYERCDVQEDCAEGYCVDFTCAMCRTADDCSEEFPRCVARGGEGPKDCYVD